ncbi:carboxypeptidase regulatory-like domain-containing protein [bacterium]|nr:MAG: carboxypeptidase regulatory-like domain-containing protein [bacterium]
MIFQKSAFLVGAIALATIPQMATAAPEPIHIGSGQPPVNVMKNAMPKFPTFNKLVPKPGFVRGFVKDTTGKPLQGAKIGVRSTAVGGSYSGSQGTTDARGYYEVKVPWGAAHFYCAGYTIDYGEGRAALGLHPVDGEAETFPSGKGHIENWVLLPYGIADRDGASERPSYANNYYGGTLFFDYHINDERPLFANDQYLPPGSEIEVLLSPVGKLIDGSQGQSFCFRKKVDGGGAGFDSFALNNIPVGIYDVSARLIEGGNPSPLRMNETGPYSGRPFGIEPKEARGKARLLLRASGAKADMAVAQHGNWDSVTISLER